MKVLMLSEDIHGLLAICKDVPTAIDWLISHYWITETTQIWDGDKQDYVFIKELLGENWQINLKQMTARELDYMFELFYFEWVAVQGT